MRYAVFGDVHSNQEALEAVLEDAYHQRCDAYACTGDLVGFHANPVECVRLVRSLNCVVVRGNYDEDVSSRSDAPDRLNPVVAHALRWHRGKIDEETRSFLGRLPLVQSMDNDDWGLVHANLHTPGGWSYIINQSDIVAHFSCQFWNISFYGHTHIPRMWEHESGGETKEISGETKVVVGNHRIYAFNVGSVGLARDGDWRAAYMIFDTVERTVELRRVEYDIELAQLKIRQCGVMPPDFGRD